MSHVSAMPVSLFFFLLYFRCNKCSRGLKETSTEMDPFLVLRLELSKCEMEVLDREGSEPKDDLLAKLRVHGKFYCVLCLRR